MKFFSRQRGFSLPEVLIAISIFGALSALSFVAFSSFSKRDALSSSTKAIVLTLRDARTKTMASVGDSRYGVSFSSDRYTLFKGDSFSGSSPSNQVSLLSSLVRASSSRQDFIFERVTGNVSSSGTIEVYLASDPARKNTVQVHGTGLVDVQ
jgi:prepilin-type N-terminal cleavage/methylation domain-containing protein